MRRDVPGSTWLRAAAALVLCVAAAGDAGAADRKALDEVRALLAAGKADEALAKAKLALVALGDDADALEAASDAAAAAKSADEALLFAHAARCAAVRAGKDERAKALAAKCDALEPADLGERAPVDEAAAAQLEAAKLCARKRFFVNAVQLFSRLESTPYAAKAEAELEKIYATKAAVAALSESKVVVPRTVTDRKARSKAAKEDAKHATWETALKIDTANYSVVTDAGSEVALSVSSAMEPMGRHYRRVFHCKDKPGERNAPMQRCTVRVYRSKAEMEAIAHPPRNVLGFYDPKDNSVTIYDPRSEGEPLASMFPTLFHEASHQFTEMISAQHVPSWLNEGTASYFEGSVLRADGRVDVNMVPSYRLAGVVGALGANEPSVKTVISYGKPESYPDDYYPVGWGLVYFLRNYQDEKLNRVYEKPYSLLLDSYRAAGGVADSFERFQKFIVADAKVAGVSDFGAFEQRFRKWIGDLDYFHGGPPDAARDFVGRAEKLLAANRPDDAEDELRFALDKNPEYLPALTTLGDLLAKLSRRDEAVSCWRRAAEAVRRDMYAAGFATIARAEAEDAVKSALGKIAKSDPETGAAFAAMDCGLVAKALAQSEKYVAAKLPRNALRVLDAASALLGGASDLEERRRDVAQSEKVDVLLPRPLDLRPGADRVWSSPGWTVDGAKLSAAKARSSLLLFDAALGDRYRFEATVRLGASGGENPFAGLVVGADAEGEWKVVGTGGEAVDVNRVFETWTPGPWTLGLAEEQRKSFRLIVDARPHLLRVSIDGKQQNELEFPAGALRGGVGLLVLDAAAEFEDVRLSY